MARPSPSCAMTMIAYAFLQHRRLAATAPKKKNQRAPASANFARRAPRHSRTLRSTTAFAMPILKRASRVIVLTVEGGAAVPGPSGQQLCRYLQLNEVPAKPLTVGLGGRLTGEAILAHAKALGCDLLIKGAYTQSRLRQMIFGGTTRYILNNAELPVLMAH
jgi:nucleotide-binding universal stress UspA family protein